MTEAHEDASRRQAVLMTCRCDPATMRALEASYSLLHLDEAQDRGDFLRAHGTGVRAVVTRGDIGADRALIEQLPNLEIIACYGVGTDAIDLGAARERGIAVTNTPDVLTGDVADIGVGLALAAMRQIARADAFTRGGEWPGNSMPLVRRFFGSKVGIVGFGRIGRTIARRLTGFDVEIGYFDAREDKGAAAVFFADLKALAQWSDMLIVTLAGGPSTTGLIDCDVLSALGPEGFLVNISRGSIVNEPDLLDALERGTIAGAGLDVFWNEPNIDPRFRALKTVVLQPHHASATIETRRDMGRVVCENLSAHFAGTGLPTQVA